MSEPVKDVSFKTYELSVKDTERNLKKLAKENVAPMDFEAGKPDGLGRKERSVFSLQTSGGKPVALKLREEWQGGGEYKGKPVNHLTFKVRAFIHEGDRTKARERMEEEIGKNPEAGQRAQVPEKSPGDPYKAVRVYLGDITNDGLQDVLIVLENGRSMVFEQKN